MLISVEETPNPNTLKFLPEQMFFENSDSKFQFTNKSEVHNSDFVKYLFDLNNIKSVFLCSSFVSVTKEDDAKWDDLKIDIMMYITDYINSNKPIISFEEKDDSKISKPDIEDNEIVLEIKELIDSRVRPAVAQDGGDIVFHDYKDGIVYLELHGACAGCPSSTLTLKDGIENMLKYYIPEIKSVESIN